VVLPNKGINFTGTEWQEIRTAVRERYRNGHHARKPRKRQKPAGKPWTPDTAPRPLPGPRIARMSL